MYICGECVELCQEIVKQERRRRNVRAPVGAALLRERLVQLVRGQDEAKEALALAARARNEGTGRVLVIGTSPSARLFLARASAHALEAPFAASDSNGVVRSGQGSTGVVPLFFSLLRASDFDHEAAQRGVVFVDGVESEDTQEALLRLWQEGIVHLNGVGSAGRIELRIRGVLFICGGTFPGLDDAVTHLGRHPEQPLTVEALTSAGVRPDWAGCLAGIARVGPLDEEPGPARGVGRPGSGIRQGSARRRSLAGAMARLARVRPCLAPRARSAKQGRAQTQCVSASALA